MPSLPSPHSSTRLIDDNTLAVGHTSASSAHVFVGSPVADDHMSEKEANGMRTVEKAAPAGTEKFALKQPRANGIPPPPAHAYVAAPTQGVEGGAVPGVRGRRGAEREDERAAERRADVGEFSVGRRLDEAGRLQRRHVDHFAVEHTKAAARALTLHEPVERPPITGSFNSTNLNVVEGAPSNVASGIVVAVAAAATMCWHFLEEASHGGAELRRRERTRRAAACRQPRNPTPPSSKASTDFRRRSRSRSRRTWRATRRSRRFGASTRNFIISRRRVLAPCAAAAAAAARGEGGRRQPDQGARGALARADGARTAAVADGRGLHAAAPRRV